jgi:rfaE bifunctional protein nucleotidyltransferase chain/domain
MGEIIKNYQELAKLKEKLNGSIVATNGCFDILHVGHVRYLQEAKSLGDYLVVGLNSDLSVRQIKGPARPVNTEENRAEILNSLNCVDFTFIFGEPTAEDFLRVLRPNIYVKGGDYNIDQLPEKKVIEEINCKVEFLPFHQGHSTTSTLKRFLFTLD